MRTIHWSIGTMLLALALARPLAAESVNPPTKPQTAPMTAPEKKNLEMVMNCSSEVTSQFVQPGHPVHPIVRELIERPARNGGELFFLDGNGLLTSVAVQQH